MAWTARIDNFTPTQNQFVVSVSYWDAADTGFATQLGSQSFTFSSSMTLTQCRNQIIAAAKEFRTAYNLSASYVGATINVP
jgi:hypothetical protein